MLTDFVEIGGFTHRSTADNLYISLYTAYFALATRRILFFHFLSVSCRLILLPDCWAD
jgi:hypothetical protein